MNNKALITVASGALILSVVWGVNVLAQTNNPIGKWQMIASGGGDGAIAWKFNPETGESFYCYRQNCFPQITNRPN